jgi:hypothetical protein
MEAEKESDLKEEQEREREKEEEEEQERRKEKMTETSILCGQQNLDLKKGSTKVNHNSYLKFIYEYSLEENGKQNTAVNGLISWCLHLVKCPLSPPSLDEFSDFFTITHSTIEVTTSPLMIRAKKKKNPRLLS